MNEASMWAFLRNKMKGFWLASRIESSAGNGIPDVIAAIKGKIVLIELKYIKEWPKRDSTLIKLPLRPEQKLFFQTRGQMCHDIWTFIRIENDYFLLPWDYSVKYCEEGGNQKEWKSSQYYLGQSVDENKLYNHLERGY